MEQCADACIWDTDMGVLVSKPSKRHVEGALVVGFTFSSTMLGAVSPVGKWIAVSPPSNCSTAQVWDSETGLLVATFKEHRYRVHCVSFSPDSKRMLSTSDDNTISVRTLDF